MANAPDLIWSVDFSHSGQALAFQGEDATTLDEIYRFDTGSDRAIAVTQMTQQTEG